MATPMTASQFVAALKEEGVDVSEYKSWRTHNRNHKGAWGPVHGVMIHHTVSSADDSSVALCYNGHATLPGPLCHSVGRNDGKVAMVSAGRANHAGSGDDDVLRAVINETSLPADNEANTDGNRHFYGLEIVNLGNGKDTYTAKQYDAAVRWAAGICRFHGWSAKSVIGHKEWQPGKIDPYGPVEGRGMFSMDTFRADVQKRLTGTPKPPAKPPVTPKPPTTPKPKPKPVVDLSNLIAAAHRDPGLKQGGTTYPADVKVVEVALKAEGLLAAQYAADGSYGTLTKNAMSAWQERCGFRGRKPGQPADGIPGLTSLKQLGAKRGFTVKS
ncbi:N-acetylmuramoyl-L-alanine amidase [Streptomyces niveus]|uniref:peptidoglycan recognition protein family protein n=1 Tax=Streptomyces niveus TaxID=193462 RepID=UPI0038682586